MNRTLIALVLAALSALAAQDPYKVGGDVKAPKLLYKVEPAFPEGAPEGTVVVKTVISDKGEVSEATVVREPDPSLGKAAIDAVRQWRFEPGTKQGKPVPVQATIEVNFRRK